MKTRLLLHTCCAPCLSSCLLVLLGLRKQGKVIEKPTDFEVTIFFYNPNITSKEEYEKRKNEVYRLLNIYERDLNRRVEILDDDSLSDRENWIEFVKEYKDEPERGKRCELCYYFRLRKSFEIAKEKSFDAVCTTLTLSPLKNTEKINLIGEEFSKSTAIRYIKSDFKKNDGFKTSIEICKKYNIYRQNFCGCEYSKR
jgi:predicted adenine nucleotide alpha hydrolase (AANH) superfamily ATPase